MCSKFGRAAKVCKLNKTRSVHQTSEFSQHARSVPNQSVTLSDSANASIENDESRQNKVMNREQLNAPRAMFLNDISIGLVQDEFQSSNFSLHLSVSNFLLYLWSFAKAFVPVLTLSILLLSTLRLTDCKSFPSVQKSTLFANPPQPLLVLLAVNDQMINFELDTGAGMTLFPENLLRMQFPNVEIHPTTVTLTGVSGPIPCLLYTSDAADE